MTKLTFISIVALLCFFTQSWAQVLNYSGPASSSLANSLVFDESPWASINNVANLADHSEVSLGISYGLRFNMQELSIRTVGAVVPSKLGVFSAMVYQSGYSKSSMTRYAAGYSRLFGESVSAGFQFNFLTHQILAADRADAFYSSLGILWQTENHLSIGIYIQNPEQSHINYADMEVALPSLFSTAVKFSPDKHFMIMLELEKAIDRDMVYKSGLQFNFKDKLYARGGILGKPIELTFGGGFVVGALSIDVGFSHHQQLGVSSGGGINYAFTSKKH